MTSTAYIGRVLEPAVRPAAILVFLIHALACAPDGKEALADTVTATADVLTVTATEYGLAGPDTVPAGFTTLRLVNRGDEPHSAALVRLEEGRTLREYIAAYGEANRTRGARPAWATHHGGTLAAPHGEAGAMIHLEPGHYAWVCFMPGADQVSHLLKHGQGYEFVVQARPENAPAPSPPRPSVTLRMADYVFEIEKRLAAGRQLIRVENAGAEAHHLMFFRLGSGQTQEDFQTWLRNGMPREGQPMLVGMMTALSSGRDAYFEAELSRGEYVLVCLVGGRDEVPHVAKGMIRHIRID